MNRKINKPVSLKKWYAEGIYIGYRYYEKKAAVNLPFGHGLNYTGKAVVRLVSFYSFINCLSASGIPPSSDTYRSTFICRSYFTRSSAIFSIIKDA